MYHMIGHCKLPETKKGSVCDKIWSAFSQFMNQYSNIPVILKYVNSHRLKHSHFEHCPHHYHGPET